MQSAKLGTSSVCVLSRHGISPIRVPVLTNPASPGRLAFNKSSRLYAGVSLRATLHGRHSHIDSRRAINASAPARPLRESGTPPAARRDEAELEADDIPDKAPTPEQRKLDKLLYESQDSDRVLHVLDRAREQGIPLTTVNMVTALVRLSKVSRQRSTVTNDPTFVALLDGIWAELKQRPDAFSPRQLTILAFSLSKMGGSAWQGLGRLERQITRRLPEFSSRDIANVAWGFAKAEHGGRDFYAAVSSEIVTRGVASFNEQDISNILWAFATAGQLGPQLYAAVDAELAVRGLDSFKPQDLSLSLHAFATAGFSAGFGSARLYDVAEEYIHSNGLEGFNAQDVSNSLWAFASAGRGSPRLYAAFEDTFQKRGAKAFSSRNIANALWAFAMAGRQPSATTKAMLMSCARSLNDDVATHVLRQLVQYVLAFAEVSERETDPAYSAVLKAWARACQGPRRPPASSAIHNEVSGALQAMGVAHESNAPFFDGIFYANMLVNGNVAVEVGGPFHYYRGSQVLSAAIEFKRRLLVKGGWQVVSIPFFEWNKAETREDKERYLREKLGECRVHVAAVGGRRKE
eukprot:jgi/Mesvir1/29704/Mv00937-RA.1